MLPLDVISYFQNCYFICGLLFRPPSSSTCVNLLQLEINPDNEQEMLQSKVNIHQVFIKHKNYLHYTNYFSPIFNIIDKFHLDVVTNVNRLFTRIINALSITFVDRPLC